MDLDWFEDDITARFKKFLKITFGKENFEKNFNLLKIQLVKI